MLKLTCMGAVYIIQRFDLTHPNIKNEVAQFCDRVIESGNVISFVPKDGYLATLGLFFTERGISYRLEFIRPQNV